MYDWHQNDYILISSIERKAKIKSNTREVDEIFNIEKPTKEARRSLMRRFDTSRKINKSHPTSRRLEELSNVPDVRLDI